jgi:hypothetical protein
MTQPFDDLTPIGKLDFRHNTTQLLGSYALRLVGVFVFGLLFVGWISVIRPDMSTSVETLLSIELANVPAVVSILLLIVDVGLVLYAHELVHAGAFYITHRQVPKIGMRGFVIFAAAPSHLLTRPQLVVNALLPLVVLSLLGGLALWAVPAPLIAWVWIPAVVNAAAAGGDIMAVVWAMRYDSNARYHDDGDIITAYLPERI